MPGCVPVRQPPEIRGREYTAQEVKDLWIEAGIADMAFDVVRTAANEAKHALAHHRPASTTTTPTCQPRPRALVIPRARERRARRTRRSSSSSGSPDHLDGDSELEDAGIPYQRPYDLRHSFASLLLHEGRSVIYVARQLGRSAALTMRTYGHVIEELDDAPRITAEDAVSNARRGNGVRPKCVEAE
jgi:hypothetical protein